jgi:hypothetical protein
VGKKCVLNGLSARTWKQNALHLIHGAGLLTERVSTEKLMAKVSLVKLKWLQN